MITGQGRVETTSEATKVGACDYLPKPLAPSGLKLVIGKAVRIERLASAVHCYNGKEARDSGLAKHRKHGLRADVRRELFPAHLRIEGANRLANGYRIPVEEQFMPKA
jgi:DNA-binding NtrC family response regulator